MAYAEIHSDYSATKERSLWFVLKSMAAAIADRRRKWRAAARYQAVADLTPDQLRDIGLPEAIRPVRDVEAVLITNLMAMR